MSLSEEARVKIQELGNFIEPYLSRLGITPDATGKIKCLSPHHHDKTPSMVLMKPERTALYCYGCGTHMNICDVAITVENKPDRGAPFISDNVNYLCEMFGLPKIEVQLTERDEQELLLQTVYRKAGSIFRNQMSHENSEARGWTDTRILTILGVGTIRDKDTYFRAVAKETGVTVNDLADMGMEPRFFGPDMLTFVLSDERGDCIGFAARDMHFEEKKAAGKPAAKYINPSHEKNLLYRKSGYVYNINRARDRKRTPTVLVTEGYGDVIACELAGIRGSVAIGGTAFSNGHAEVISKTGIRDIVLGMDYDFGENSNRSGQEGALKAIGVLRSYPSTRARVLDWEKIRVDMEKKTGRLKKYDVDLVLRLLGDSYLKQAIETSCTPVIFKVNELKARGMDDRAIAEAVIPDIAVVDDELLVQEYAENLSEVTGYDYDLLLGAIKKQRRLRDQDLTHQLEEIRKNAERALARQEDIGQKIDVLRGMVEQATALDPRGKSSTIEADIRKLQTIESQADGITFTPVARCGIPQYDEDLGGGLPLYGKTLIHGGRPHVGKTQLLQFMLTGVRKYNPNVETFVWTLDDDTTSWYQRLWSCISGLPIYMCQRPAEYLRGNEQGMERYNHARELVRSWTLEGLLTIRDGSTGNHISVLENMLRERVRRTNRPIIVFFDNFHKTAGASDRQQLESTAGIIKGLGQELGITFVCNAELRKKSSDDDGRRPPTEDDLKESGKLHYDADYLILVDSPHTRLPFDPSLVDKNGNQLKSYKDYHKPNFPTYWQSDTSTKDMPVVHLHRKKNKIFSIDGQAEKTFYLDFDPRIVSFKQSVLARDSVDINA